MFVSTIWFVAFGLWLPVCFAEYSEGMEHYRKAWAAYAQQRFQEAEAKAQAAVKADPQNAHAFSLLGELAYLRHDLGSAKRMWEKALALHPQLIGPLSGQIAQVEMELELEGQLRELASRNGDRLLFSSKQGRQGKSSLSPLAIRVPKDLPADQGQAILATLGEATETLEPYFQYRPQRPLTVLIYPRESFYGQLHVPTEVLGLFDGKIRIPAETEKGTGYFSTQSLSVLWHEYAHAVVFDLSHGRAPRWLHEGLAQEAERIKGDRLLFPQKKGAGLPASRQATFPGQVETSGKGVGPLESVLKLEAVLGIAQRPGEPVVLPVAQFYPASHSLVRYLLELEGWDRMRAFLKELGKGKTVEEAIQDLYGWDLQTLEKKWKSWEAGRKK